jgi:hypothetical protein
MIASRENQTKQNEQLEKKILLYATGRRDVVVCCRSSRVNGMLFVNAICVCINQTEYLNYGMILTVCSSYHRL